MLECDGSGNIPVMDIVDGVNENSARLDAWSASVTYKIGSFIYNGTDGFYYQALVENAGSQPVIGNVNWQRWSPVNYFEMDITKTVGATGDYATLVEALTAASRWISVDGAVFTIEIEDGHTIDYPVQVDTIAEGVIVTYAGTGSLSININNHIATSNGEGFFQIGGKGFTFQDVNISLIGVYDTSGLDADNWVCAFRGNIAFVTVDFDVNITVTNHKILIFRLDNWCNEFNIVVTNLNSPELSICVIFNTLNGAYAGAVIVNGNNLSIGKLFEVSYGNNYISGCGVLNAVNCITALSLYKTTNATIANGTFRKGVSDDTSDIKFDNAIASIDSATIGGANLVEGTWNANGGRI